jgi:endo-1,4-beta-mannosidase
MTAAKYEKYFIREPIEMGRFAPNLRYTSDFADTDFTFRWHYITSPYIMEAEPHAHDFDQFTCFMGGNPVNIREFGAEVELFLGEEGEKYIINTTTVIYIPRGLVHGPLNFKTVSKPIMFMNFPLTSHYRKK